MTTTGTLNRLIAFCVCCALIICALPVVVRADAATLNLSMTALRAQYSIYHLRHKLEFRSLKPQADSLRKSKNRPFNIAARYAMMVHGENPFARVWYSLKLIILRP